MPLAEALEAAAPDALLLMLLRRRAARPRTTLQVASGRPRETRERWPGVRPVRLHAEHGL